MSQRAKIVERLLEEKHITAAEAVVLLQPDVVIDVPSSPPIIDYPPNWENPFKITGDDDMVPYGEICSCNPKNGGSGICGCVMANKLVPKTTQPYTNFKTMDHTTSDIIFTKCPNEVCYCDGSCQKQRGNE